MLSSVLSQPAGTDLSASAPCSSHCCSISLGNGAHPSRATSAKADQCLGMPHCCQCMKCMAWIVLWQVLNYFHWLKEVPKNGPWQRAGVRHNTSSLGAEVPFQVAVGLSALSRHAGCTGKSDLGKQEASCRRLEKVKSWNVWIWSLWPGHSPWRQKESSPQERSIAWMIVSLVMPKAQHGVSRQVDLFTSQHSHHTAERGEETSEAGPWCASVILALTSRAPWFVFPPIWDLSQIVLGLWMLPDVLSPLEGVRGRAGGGQRHARL